MEIHFINTKRMTMQFLEYCKTIDIAVPKNTTIHIIPNEKKQLQNFRGYIKSVWFHKMVGL